MFKLPARAIAKQVEEMLGPPNKPNETAKMFGVTWDYSGYDQDLSVILHELVPVIVDDGKAYAVEHVAVPITEVRQDYGIHDILHQNRRDHMGKSAVTNIQIYNERKEREHQYRMADIEAEAREFISHADREVKHFGSWSHRG